MLFFVHVGWPMSTSISFASICSTSWLFFGQKINMGCGMDIDVFSLMFHPSTLSWVVHVPPRSFWYGWVVRIEVYTFMQSQNLSIKHLWWLLSIQLFSTCSKITILPDSTSSIWHTWSVSSNGKLSSNFKFTWVQYSWWCMGLIQSL